MASSTDLRAVFSAARPLIEEWLDVAEQIAALREMATDKGLDWSQVKALVKAQVQDERAGETKRVHRIIEKAEFASAYAGMLGLAKMNENNFSDENFDPETGEIHDAGSGQRIGRQDDEQRDAARVSRSDGSREGDDEGHQGQRAGASGDDRDGGPVAGTVDCQDEDRGSRHVGGEARHEITRSDGGAIGGVKDAKCRLPDAVGVEPPPSDKTPAQRSTDDLEIPAFLKRTDGYAAASGRGA